MESLELLLADGIIDGVFGQLKSGKEAAVYLVRRGPDVLAAKVYKERQDRSFRNNAAYKEGRQVRNTRTQRAVAKGSRFGQAAADSAWKAAEADALFKLHASGARVPKPVMFYEGVLLMEVVVDPEGHPAPRLVDARIRREAAATLYEEVRAQAVKMLCADLIHGDLSPFNVLLAYDGPTLIDFPQVISAAHNNSSEHFFKRDLGNVHRFFAAIEPSLHGRASDCDEVWRAYLRRELTPDFVPSGRPALQGGPPPHAHRRQERREHTPTRGGMRAGPQVSYLGQTASRPAQDGGPQAARQGPAAGTDQHERPRKRRRRRRARSAR